LWCALRTQAILTDRFIKLLDPHKGAQSATELMLGYGLEALMTSIKVKYRPNPRRKRTRAEFLLLVGKVEQMGGRHTIRLHRSFDRLKSINKNPPAR
jgi:hypothetical protein